MEPNPYMVDINDSWRFEYKYRLSIQQYHQLKTALRPYISPDKYTSNQFQNRYIVRSLYFDSTDLHAFQEKINGDCDRTKLRIRTYTATEKPDSEIRVEMKARKGISVEKRNTFVTVDDYQWFMKNKQWPANSNPVLVEFERYLHLKHLKPQILIEYFREGFFVNTQRGLRLTFDHNVKSAAATTLFPAKPFFYALHRNAVVFEIKCDKSQPNWLFRLIKQNNLSIAANSKFAQGIQLSRPEIIQPFWSY
jgi:hypothetical protein